jgi:hypothetical protein
MEMRITTKLGPSVLVLSFRDDPQARQAMDADGLTSSWPPEIVARRLVEHLERAGFVVMKRPPTVRGAALARGFEG